MARKLRRSNLSEDAYAVVRDILLNGNRYNPGDKVSVEQLSRELGVSRTPLWAAINRPCGRACRRSRAAAGRLSGGLRSQTRARDVCRPRSA